MARNSDTEVSQSPTRLEMQHSAIDEAQDKIKDRYQHVAGTVGTGLVDAESLSQRSGTRQYLEGYSDGLSWAHEVVGKVHRLPPESGPSWATGDIGDEKVENIFRTLLSEAANSNWGNAQANLERLEQALEDAQDGGADD